MIFSNLICTLFKVLEGEKVGCVLDSQSRAGFWKYDTAAVHAVRTIQYNTIIILFITVGARGGRSVNATTNGPRKCLGMTPVDSYGLAGFLRLFSMFILIKLLSPAVGQFR
jgi:hypothetical protein